MLHITRLMFPIAELFYVTQMYMILEGNRFMIGLVPLITPYFWQISPFETHYTFYFHPKSPTFLYTNHITFYLTNTHHSLLKYFIRLLGDKTESCVYQIEDTYYLLS